VRLDGNISFGEILVQFWFPRAYVFCFGAKMVQEKCNSSFYKFVVRYKERLSGANIFYLFIPYAGPLNVCDIFTIHYKLCQEKSGKIMVWKRNRPEVWAGEGVGRRGFLKIFWGTDVSPLNRLWALEEDKKNNIQHSTLNTQHSSKERGRAFGRSAKNLSANLKFKMKMVGQGPPYQWESFLHLNIGCWV
jgi:hypothetical protein